MQTREACSVCFNRPFSLNRLRLSFDSGGRRTSFGKPGENLTLTAPQAERPIRTAIVEDDPALRKMLAALLQADPDYAVVAEFAEGNAAVQPQHIRRAEHHAAGSKKRNERAHLERAEQYQKFADKTGRGWQPD